MYIYPFVKDILIVGYVISILLVSSRNETQYEKSESGLPPLIPHSISAQIHKTCVALLRNSLKCRESDAVVSLLHPLHLLRKDMTAFQSDIINDDAPMEIWISWLSVFSPFAIYASYLNASDGASPYWIYINLTDCSFLFEFHRNA